MNPLVAVVLAVLASGCSKTRSAPPPSGAGSGEGEAAAFVDVARDALVGHPAPAVTLYLLDGSSVDLASLENVQKFVADKHLTFPIAIDRTAASPSSST